jgi:hypothetical protein
MIDSRPYNRPAPYLVSLVHELCALPSETEWVEFKVNHAEPQTIGSYISGLANAAALVGKAFAYLVWGVRDEDHALVGTMFDPCLVRVGNEELESWLLRLLEPKIDFRFFRVMVESRSMVLLEVARATRHPVCFQGQEFVRIGSYKKRLKEFSEKERLCIFAGELLQNDIIDLEGFAGMLIKFSVANFRSVLSRQTLSLAANDKDDHLARNVSSAGEDVGGVNVRKRRSGRSSRVRIPSSSQPPFNSTTSS